jgi:putative membrane protein
MYTLPAFGLWFTTCALLLAVFGFIYAMITPKRELAMIREGNVAVAVAFSGALIGYSLTLASVMMSAASRVDLALWAVVGLIVQLGAYGVAALLLGNIRERFGRGEVAAGVFIGGLSIAVGIINAATMVY